MNTTVAPQALALLNDPFVRLRAEEFAQRLQAEAQAATLEAQIRRAFQLCLGRDPFAERTRRCPSLHRRHKPPPALGAMRSSHPRTAQRLALTDFCQSLFGLNEFIYID